MSKIFTIKFTYFKNNGKFYCSAEVDRDFSSLSNGNCNMYEVIDWVNNIIEERKETLPGLAGSSWDGFIVINCEEGFPHLFLPN